MIFLKLRERDFKLLYYISTQNFATADELFSLFWNSKKNTGSHYRRFSDLIKGGLIEKLNGPENTSSGYTITLKGQNLLRVKGYHVLPYVFKKDSYTGTYNHDLLVHKVKNILLKSPLIKNFIPEYQIAGKLLKNSPIKNKYKNKDKIPDGLFTLRLNNRPQLIALELELSLKSKKRYENIFLKHLLTPSWDTIFYIVDDEAMREKLLERIKVLKRKSFLLKGEKRLNKIYFALIDEFLKKELNCLFVNDAVEFCIRNLEKKEEARGETK